MVLQKTWGLLNCPHSQTHVARCVFLEVVPNQVHNPLDEGCTLVERARLAGHAITSANLNLSGEYGRDIQIEIPVEGLEGRTVTVVSCSNDTPELLTAEIKNGHATFRLKEPVPFALLDDDCAYDCFDISSTCFMENMERVLNESGVQPLTGDEVKALELVRMALRIIEVE